eukprot:8525256-Pyramimonas_sp.AAC.1
MGRIPEHPCRYWHRRTREMKRYYGEDPCTFGNLGRGGVGIDGGAGRLTAAGVHAMQADGAEGM